MELPWQHICCRDEPTNILRCLGSTYKLCVKHVKTDRLQNSGQDYETFILNLGIVLQLQCNQLSQFMIHSTIRQNSNISDATWVFKVIVIETFPSQHNLTSQREQPLYQYYLDSFSASRNEIGIHCSVNDPCTMGPDSCGHARPPTRHR